MTVKTIFLTKRLRRTGVAAGVLAGLLLAGCSGDTPEKALASAEAYLAKGDTRAAVIQLKNSLQANPESGRARYLLGQALLDSGDPVAALVELEKARDLKYADEAVVPALARALVAQGRFKAVVDRFASVPVPAQASAAADLQTSLAISRLSLGDRAGGEATLTKALAAKPDHVPALMARSRLLAADGQFDAALALIDKSLAATPKEADLWNLRGDVLMHGKSDADGAEAAYRKAVSIRADYLPAHAGIVFVTLFKKDLEAAAKQVETLKKLLPQNPQTRYLEAQVAFAQGNDKLAKELASQLLKIAPEDARLLHLAGAAELRAGGALQAQAYLQKSLQLVPANRSVRLLLAQSYARSGQGTLALSTLGPTLDSGTPDADALSVAAQAHASLGDLKKAESLYAAAAKLSPTDTRSKTALALTHMAMGDLEAGFGELQRISSSDTGISADLALVHANLRTKRYDAMLEALDALERKSPGTAVAAHLRALALLGLKKPDQTRQSLERALSIDPNYYPSIEALALLDVAEGKPEVASKRYEDLLARQPGSLQAKMALAGLRGRTGASNDEVAKLLASAISAHPQEAGPRLALINLYITARTWRPALVAAQEGVAAIPASPDLLDALGRVQALSGDSYQARVTFTRLASLQPQSPVPQLRLAEIQRLDKDSAGAIQSLNRALALQPDLVEAQRKLIGIEVAAGRYPAALKIARTIQSQRPKEAIGYALEGDIEYTRKDPAAAANAYRSGLKSVADPMLATKLHGTLMASGKRADADAFAAAWQKDRPGDAQFALYLGQATLQRGQFDEAERQFSSVVASAPKNVVALNNLAWARTKLGRRDALPPAEEANRLSPNQPPLMETLAVALALNDQLPKAIELQKKAVQAQPANNDFRLTLAKLHIQAGQPQEAKSQLTVLSNLGEKYAGQPEVARMLKAL